MHPHSRSHPNVSEKEDVWTVWINRKRSAFAPRATGRPTALRPNMTWCVANLRAGFTLRAEATHTTASFTVRWVVLSAFTSFFFASAGLWVFPPGLTTNHEEHRLPGRSTCIYQGLGHQVLSPITCDR